MKIKPGDRVVVIEQYLRHVEDWERESFILSTVGSIARVLSYEEYCAPYRVPSYLASKYPGPTYLPLATSVPLQMGAAFAVRYETVTPPPKLKPGEINECIVGSTVVLPVGGIRVLSAEGKLELGKGSFGACDEVLILKDLINKGEDDTPCRLPAGSRGKIVSVEEYDYMFSDASGDGKGDSPELVRNWVDQDLKFPVETWVDHGYDRPETLKGFRSPPKNEIPLCPVGHVTVLDKDSMLLTRSPAREMQEKMK